MSTLKGGDLVNKNVQTTLIPAGGSAIVDFKVEVPGTFIIVDHSIFRTFNKGSLGMLKVTGDENKTIYSGKQIEGIYHPEGGTIQSMPNDDKVVSFPQASLLELKANCGGQSQCTPKPALPATKRRAKESQMPSHRLAKSDYLNENVDRAIDIVLHGKSGEVTVNGKKYNSVMTAQTLSDDEVANVLTYVYSNWGNSKKDVSAAMVAKVRNKQAH
jgi:nitrite reductase (NO-forming)